MLSLQLLTFKTKKMKKKITWMMTAILLSYLSVNAQSACNDLNGYVSSKNQNGISFQHLQLGAEEYAGQTYHLNGGAIISSVKIHGHYPGLGGGVPLRVSICNVDANGRPTSVIKLMNTVWWKFNNTTGSIIVFFPRGGVYVNNDFAVTVQVLNDFPFGDAFDLKYTGDNEGLNEDLSSLAGISTGFNWASANQTFGKDGDYYLIPEIKHFVYTNFNPSTRCAETNTSIQFQNTSLVNKDSMFNRIMLSSYEGPNYIYNWNFGDGSAVSHLENPTHTYTTSGTYTVTLTCTIDGWQGICSKSISKQISVGLQLTAQNINQVSCYGSNNGSVTLLASGGAQNYLYSKDGVTYQSGNTFNNLNAGQYTFYVKDILGCIKTTNVTIQQPAAIQFTTFNSTNASCGNADGSIIVAANGGTSPYTYKLNSGNYQSSGSFINLPIGVYMITAKDANQCTKTIPIAVNDLGGPQISAINSTNISCFASNDGSISISTTGGTGNVMYSIDGGTNYQSSTVFQQLTAGVYHVIVKDAAQCTDISTIALQQPNKLYMNIETVPTKCNGSADGEIKVTASSGGIGSHRYSLNGVYYQSDKNFTGLQAGTYVVYLKDIANCLLTDTVTINEPMALNLFSTTVPVTCNGGSNGIINSFGDGGIGEFQYSINNANFQYNNQFSNLNAGSYTVTIRDENLCLHTDTILVEEPSLITAVVSTTNSSCGNSNGGLIVTASGGEGSYTYSLDGNNYNSTGIFNPLSSGTYYISVKDVQQCEIITSGTIRDSDGPVIVNVSSTDATCNGAKNASISVIEVNGGSGILRYSINGHNWQTGHDFYNLNAGTYTVMVKDGLGCISSQAITLTQPNAFVINPIVTDANCYGANGSVTIAAAGGSGVLAYSVTEGYIFQSSNVFNLTAGTYQVIVKDAANCSSYKEFTINQPNDIRISTAVLNATCHGDNNGAIIAHAGGGSGLLQYSLNGINYTTSNAFTNLPGGITYILYVKDALNCVRTSSVFVYQPNVLLVESTIADVTCAGGNNGAINLSVSGGMLPYQYNWSNGQHTQGIFNLTEGNYSVTVNDFNGCSEQLNFSIDQPQNPLIVNAISNNSSGGAIADGSIDITVTGGVAPYTYLWSNGSTTEDITNLLPGAYLITITDVNGCITSATFMVNSPVGISTTNSTTNQLKVYPNPANQYITIELGNQQFDKIELINVLGQVVYFTTEKENKLNITTSNLENGMYFFKFMNKNEIITKKINIQH
jgi:PKD repeat protein